MERRRFIQLAAALPALPFAACRRRGASTPPSCAVSAIQKGPGRALDETEWSTVRAACARLIPTDHDPGADEANVVCFIDAQLSEPPVSNFRQEFSSGLQQMNQLAGQLGGARFADLSPDKQDRVLRQMQRGGHEPAGPRTSRARRFNSGHFFIVLLTLTLEGFFCDPVYGGNTQRVGWKFIGQDPRPPHPRCPYRSPA
jgi:hypothetical protein